MFHNWFIEAYGILIQSKTEARTIPLTELVSYRDNLGLIGTFREFVEIIYAIDAVYNKYHLEKEMQK